MSDDIRTELTALRDTVHAGFARIDRYFELQQAQHLGLSDKVDNLGHRVDGLSDKVDNLIAEVRDLNRRVDRVEERLTGLEHSVRAVRDWAAGEFADVRLELRRLRQDVVDRDAALRGDVVALRERVDRLERRWLKE